jgi:hypothetical protein
MFWMMDSMTKSWTFGTLRTKKEHHVIDFGKTPVRLLMNLTEKKSRDGQFFFVDGKNDDFF